MGFSAFILMVTIPFALMIFGEIVKVRKQHPLSYPMRLDALMNVAIPYCGVMIIFLILATIVGDA